MAEAEQEQRIEPATAKATAAPKAKRKTKRTRADDDDGDDIDMSLAGNKAHAIVGGLSSLDLLGDDIRPVEFWKAFERSPATRLMVIGWVRKGARVLRDFEAEYDRQTAGARLNPNEEFATMRHRVNGCLCGDCEAVLMLRSTSPFGVGFDSDWFMVKDRVWRASQRNGACRFLCIRCLEARINRRLSPADFKRSARVNFVGRKSSLLRSRLRGLKPARRLIETTWTP